MASCKKEYPVDFFKRDILCETNSDSKSQLDTTRSEESEDEISSEVESSSEYEVSSESEIEEEFDSEDRQISRLYREVVDDVMASNKLKESTVDAAIRDIREDIHLGHKKGFRKFPGIDFCRPENCCGYLRRYAICHTGLVKKLMWKFFLSKMSASKIATLEIKNNHHLRVVSLGGGPGNDLVGFCSALQEIPNSVEKLDLIVVDISEGWKPVFPKILLKARFTDFGSFSQCLRKKIMTGFMAADLTKRRVFRDKNLSSVLGQADVLLMVKLTSFLCDEDADNLLHNVIDSMKPQAKLIFIDYPFDGQFFEEIESLERIYHDTLKYELCFNPKKSHSPSISDTYAHVAVLQKKLIQAEDSSSDSEEA